MSNSVTKLRTALGWNRVDFAKAIGRSHQSVRNYERGVEPPPEVLKKIKKLADKHGLGELLESVEPEQSPAPRRSGKRKSDEGPMSPGSAGDNERWHELLDEILASGDQDAIIAVQNNLVIFSKFVRSRSASRLREKAG